MSDSIKHECAVAQLRLRQPISYYQQKYGTSYYGYQQMSLLLEKQHNRGQDGAGLAALLLNPEPGSPAYRVEKAADALPLAELLERCGQDIVRRRQTFGSEAWTNDPLAGECLLGHLRYGTFGSSGIEACHPFWRGNPCLSHTLFLAGNFNLTDADGIFQLLEGSGHHLSSRADGALILNLLGHYLEQEIASCGTEFKLIDVLKKTASHFDGGYTLCGMLGNGYSFALRDPAGIRPGFYYYDDEIAVVASERPALQTAFNLTSDQVQELPPGHAMIVTPAGEVSFEKCLEAQELRQCVFERIYFSRGNDADINRERRQLGACLVDPILEALQSDWRQCFFSYIPNTAQISFFGMVQELLHKLGSEVRFGQIAVKDAKFRTFIADASARKEFYQHIYDITYGLIEPGKDALVVLDDSIVRGSTMRNAILPLLMRLKPREIIIASTAPPIKYPDCYGIDMASLKELIAFEAAVLLMRQRGNEALLYECYEEAKRQLRGQSRFMTNCVKPIYDQFSLAELSDGIRDLIRPAELEDTIFKVVFQSCDNLRQSCPQHTGDWYFTGDYPTPGGCRVVNQALVNYMENIDGRAY